MPQTTKTETIRAIINSPNPIWLGPAMIIASLVMLIIAIWVFRAGSKAKKAEDAAFTASFGYNDFKNTESGSFEFYKSPGNIESENTNK